MARLSTAARKKLPGKDFAGPGRSFPENDKAHDRAAIRLAPRALHAGHISSSEEHHIVAEARAKLHEGSTHKHFNSHGLKHESGVHHED